MKQQTFVAQPDDVTAFHVNQRNELIDLHGKSGALMATRSDQVQTFVLQGNMIGRKDENVRKATASTKMSALRWMPLTVTQSAHRKMFTP